MRSVFGLLVAVLALSLAGRAPAAAQRPDSPVSSDAASGAAVTQPTYTTAQSPASMGAAAPAALPQREQAPRTLRAYRHVFIAFAVTWVLLFGYVISLGWRWARLERDLSNLSRGDAVAR